VHVLEHDLSPDVALGGESLLAGSFERRDLVYHLSRIRAAAGVVESTKHRRFGSAIMLHLKPQEK
jgi:hypothetical protein